VSRQPPLPEPLLDETGFTNPEPEALSNWQLFRRRFVRHRLGLISIAILVILMVACYGATWLAPHKQNMQNLLETDLKPSLKHPFGTDDLGRDQLSEIMYAGRISLTIGLAVALLSTIVGVTVGAIAAYYGKVTDQLLSSLTDLFLILPDIALLAVAIQHFGHGQSPIIFVLAAVSWTYLARVVRAEVLSLKEKEFVEAARASGASARRIVMQHILPNCLGVIMVNATLTVAIAISSEAALSFLGFGVQPPHNSWGRMLADAEPYINSTEKWYLVFFPGFMLLMTILAVNFLGDALRDALDPQSRF
jgi:peptide/nickel transport system permease protein